MIAFLILWFLLIAIVDAFPTLALKKRRGATWWDYTFPFTGVFAWVVLGMANLGSTATLSNFVVELFWIAILSAILPWMRWVLCIFKRKPFIIFSALLTVLPIVTAVVIRLSMPTLPE